VRELARILGTVCQGFLIVVPLKERIHEMHSQELSQNCCQITKTVGRWLAEQDELTSALHQVAVETIQMAGDAPMGAFLTTFEANYPLLFEDCGRRYIESKADAFLSSEFTELSALFSVFYEEFNGRFFEGSLPRYRVKVMHDIPKPESPDTSVESIQVSVDRREIALQYNGWPENMLGWLVRFMAYIRIGEGSALQAELDRLRRVGAPTPDEVDRLERAGWTMYAASPWSVS
jgi:hypothetical protein